MKWIKKIIKSYFLKKGYRKFSAGELKMMLISSEITSKYINSRTFRRKMDELGIGKDIKNTIQEWSK